MRERRLRIMGSSNSTAAATAEAATPGVLALFKLHTSLGGAHWRTPANWLQQTELCQPGVKLTGVRCRARAVDVINLSDNDLAGTLPTQIGVLTTLQELRLNSGSISGTLPTQLARLSNLRVLSAHSNRITGTLPTQTARLGELNVLDLDDNSLSGTLPAFVGHLEKLKRLELHANSLSGTLPIFASSRLTTLDMEENSLVGSIPTQIGILNELREFRVAKNKLSGSLPVSMAALNIHDLTVDWKQLNGGQRPPWVRRNRGRSGRLKHFATLGTPYDNRTALPDDSDEAVALEGEMKALEEFKMKVGGGLLLRKRDEL